MRNDKKRFYNKRWATPKKVDFFGYERNRILPEFFPPTERHEKVLDLGCGSGQVAAYLKKQGYRIWGIDISKRAVSLAKKLKIGEFLVGDIEEKLPYRPSFFDIVFWGDGIEHVFEPEKVLKEVKRVLKPGGRVIISCPNMAFWIYRWHYLKTGTIPHTEGHQCEPWQTGHIRFFNSKILARLLKKTGFKPTKIRGASKPGMNSFFSKFWPELFASIILVEARSLR